MAYEDGRVLSGLVGVPAPDRPGNLQDVRERLARAVFPHPPSHAVRRVGTGGGLLRRAIRRVSGDRLARRPASLLWRNVCGRSLSISCIATFFIFVDDSPWGRRAHFLLHGVHHDFPNDADRLVMPLLTSTPMAVIFFALFGAALGPAAGPAFFAGFVVGYLFYDGTHYARSNQLVPRSRWGKLLRRHHLTHHFADHDGGFGVSTLLWDVVFGPCPESALQAESFAGRGCSARGSRTNRASFHRERSSAAAKRPPRGCWSSGAHRAAQSTLSSGPPLSGPAMTTAVQSPSPSAYVQ